MAEFSITNFLQESKEDPKKIAPIVVIIGLAAFLVWKFGYSPKAAMITNELKKNKGIERDMKNFKNAANQLEDIKLNIEEMTKKWDDSHKLCYKEMERTDFLKRVRELATKANINVKSINPLPEEELTIGVIPAKKFSVQFNYSGDLEKLLTFMRFVELEPKITFMPIPKLAPNASGTFEIALKVSTILFPDVISTDMAEGEEDDDEGDED
ncbi:MAG: hypothetical protein J6Z11_00090 [Candidatus Riflebacteria bacterium]|nr:hypothetical protein [Candidatus Riflebacteria bacterium]